MYKIGLFNDSFPPTIDGVANAVFNYATILNKHNFTPTVVTPKYPNVVDNYSFDVYRYHSAKLTPHMPYRVGNPFSPLTIHELSKKEFDILHVHSPFASSVLAHELSIFRKRKIPTILTYHTKFDIDIDRYIDNKQFNKVARKFVKTNIEFADDVWAVSKGTIDSLRKFGYNGEVFVIPNGTDFTKGRSSQEQISELDRIYCTQNEELVLLYCGRMMWYKNIKIILDTLKILTDSKIKFKMFFVGDGPDRPYIEKYAHGLGLKDIAIFTGAIYDREKVRTFFSRANLFLFPSTYDTSGLVVKEAAACGCASALIKGSCAAEDVVDGVSGILAEYETAESFAKSILSAIKVPELLGKLGKCAQDTVYLSWEDSVAIAEKRYEYIIEKYKK